jgi:hypothetical protein
MGEPILSPDDPQPKRRRPSRTPWIHRELPADPLDRVLFLFERIERAYSLFIMRDLGHLYYAIEAAQPSPIMRRQWRKEFRHARGSSQVVDMMLGEAWCKAAAEPSRRTYTRRHSKKRAAENAWLKKQLGTLEESQ